MCLDVLLAQREVLNGASAVVLVSVYARWDAEGALEGSTECELGFVTGAQGDAGDRGVCCAQLAGGAGEAAARDVAHGRVARQFPEAGGEGGA